jgi:glycosyltransferase involved in cell wall biosynthesis
MHISIVIPAFNAAVYLRETVESVLAQTHRDWELILVNDGSHDGTAELADALAERDPRIRVRHQANHGLPGARNAGYKETSPDAVAIIFLDADDVWEPTALALLGAALDANPNAVAAHGVARFINARSELQRPGSLERVVQNRKAVVGKEVVPWPADAPTTFAVLAINCCIVSAGMVLLRRSALEIAQEGAALFDPMPSLPRASLEDWDLWLRLARQGEFVVVQEPLLNYRTHTSNLSQQKWLMFLGEVYVRRKAAALPGLTDEQSFILARGTQYWLATHARRVAAGQFFAAQELWKQRQWGAASRHLRQGLHEYRRYLTLRRSRNRLSPEQVQATFTSEEFLREAAALFQGSNQT